MAYFGVGSKEEIFSNLDTVISAVSGINHVDYQRDDVHGLKYENYPGVYINDLGTSKEYRCQNIVKNAFAVGLILFVWADDDEDLMTVMNAFVEDVKDAIMTDPTRGSKAYSTHIDDVLTDAGSNHPQAVVGIKITIIYYSSE